MTNRRKVGTTSSHHGPYGLGYTRATMDSTMGSNTAKWSKSLKAVCSPTRKGHDDLTSSSPSSGLSPAVSLEFPPLCAGN